jgi:hypothetical protein
MAAMFRPLFTLAVATTLLTGTGCLNSMVNGMTAMTSSMWLDQTRQSGTVLKEYDSGGMHYLVMQNGPLIRKYGIDTQGTPIVAYEVDPVTRICRSGRNVVDCQHFQADPDLAAYLGG